MIKNNLFSKRKILITASVLLAAILITYFAFINEDRAEKTSVDNSNNKLNLQKSTQIEEATFIEDSKSDWLPIFNPVPIAVKSEKDGEKKWEWKYRKANDYNICLTLRDSQLSLQYEFFRYKAEQIDLSDVIDKLSLGDGNFDVKLISIIEDDYNNVFAVFSFSKDDNFLKIQCIENTFNKFIYQDEDIKDINFIYSKDTSSQSPIHEAILRCKEGKYSIEIASSSYSKKLILPEVIQNPIGFCNNDDNIYLEIKEGEHYAVYLVDFINNTVRKITNTNKIDNILSMQEIFSSGSDSLNLFVVGEYKNILALHGSDGKSGGFHEKESFSLIDKDTYRQLLHIESSIEVPSIRYHIDSENRYCYILHDTYIKKYDMLTGNVIWEYESTDLGGFTIVDNVIYLTENNYAVIIDSSTGKEVSKVDIAGYEEVVYSSTKAQKLFAIKDELNTTVKLLDKYGKAVKEFSGSIFYNDNEFIILESKSQDNKSRMFKYISLKNPDKELEIALNSKESLHVLNNDYLIISQNDSIKLFSIDDRKYIWEKEIGDFKAAKIYKDNIYISGRHFICAAVKDGKEKWRVDNYFNEPLDYIFSLGNKLFISHNGTGTDSNYYRVYNIDTGEYLYHISDFYAVLSNAKNVYPFYQSSDKAYISKYGGGICVINE